MGKNKTVECINIKESERLLLHAIIEEDDDLSLQYYSRWSQTISFEDIEHGSFMLIPMLYRRYSFNGKAYENKKKIAGIYRNSLYRNHMLFTRCLEAIREINNKGINTVVLKGGALVASYYHDYGVRPMNDLDILVEEFNICETVKILANLGWKQEAKVNVNKLIKAYHSVHMVQEDGYEMDVHWEISDYWFREKSDKSNRFATEVATLAGYDIKILSPTYQILHNCIHGFSWNPVSSVRWVVDVLIILKNRKNEINWDLFIEETKSEGIGFLMESRLKYLSEEFSAPIPEKVLRQLELIPKSKEEIRFSLMLIKRPTFIDIGRKWRTYLYINRFELKDRNFFMKGIFFADYLKALWILESRLEIPGYMLKRGINKFMKVKN